jgi:AmmeMemoRadiSam system protein B
MTVRPSAVAGLFYPADPVVLREDVVRLLATASVGGEPSPKGLIAPHAGYEYSGPVAASAYARLKPVREVVTRVVLLGPSHRVPFVGLAASSASEFATPLGNVPVDAAGVEAASGLAQVQYLDEAHAAEHSLEVQLPFLQVALDKFQIVPIVVGDATGAQVAEVIDLLWGGPETLIVVSSDLSHYHDHATAARIDQTTADLIQSFRVDELSSRRACGYLPIRGLLEGVRSHGLSLKTVDLRDSSQTAGDASRVVGYGAFVAC